MPERPARARSRPLAGNAIRLFLTSATILFVELLLIRWVPANVVYVGYFSNFLLMASFLGHRRRDPVRTRRQRGSPISPFAPLLFAVVLLVTRAQINVQLETPNDIFFGPHNSGSANANFLVLPFIVMLVTVVMAGLAIPLGGLLTSMRPLRAYAIDIAGSMAGILAFTLLSAAGTSPLVWFAIVAIMLSVLGLGVGLSRRSLVTALSMVGVLVIALGAETHGDVWSPYYRLHEYQGGGGQRARRERRAPPGDAAGRPVRRTRSTSRSTAGSRTATSGGCSSWVPGAARTRRSQLSHGVDSIDAVEIDPVIQAIGVRDHPDQPYSDPRVHRYVDDGRAFVRNATGTYDLVIFALPDSLTLVSTSANLRLESFLFTNQAFASVRDHLAPGGIFVLYNFYREPWLVQKMAGMLQTSFGGRRRSSGSTRSSATRRRPWPTGRASRRSPARRHPATTSTS